MHLHAFRISQGISQLKERDVRVLRHQFFEEGPMWVRVCQYHEAGLEGRASRVPAS